MPVTEVIALVPPVLVRRMKAAPCPEVIDMEACAEFAFNVSRIITPAFAPAAVLPTVSTRARISQSPLAD